MSYLSRCELLQIKWPFLALLNIGIEFKLWDSKVSWIKPNWQVCKIFTLSTCNRIVTRDISCRIGWNYLISWDSKLVGIGEGNHIIAPLFPKYYASCDWLTSELGLHHEKYSNRITLILLVSGYHQFVSCNHCGWASWRFGVINLVEALWHSNRKVAGLVFWPLTNPPTYWLSTDYSPYPDDIAHRLNNIERSD